MSHREHWLIGYTKHMLCDVEECISLCKLLFLCLSSNRDCKVSWSCNMSMSCMNSSSELQSLEELCRLRSLLVYLRLAVTDERINESYAREKAVTMNCLKEWMQLGLTRTDWLSALTITKSWSTNVNNSLRATFLAQTAETERVPSSPRNTCQRRMVN